MKKDLFNKEIVISFGQPSQICSKLPLKDSRSCDSFFLRWVTWPFHGYEIIGQYKIYTELWPRIGQISNIHWVMTVFSNWSFAPSITVGIKQFFPFRSFSPSKSSSRNVNPHHFMLLIDLHIHGFFEWFK